MLFYFRSLIFSPLINRGKNKLTIVKKKSLLATYVHEKQKVLQSTTSIKWCASR